MLWTLLSGINVDWIGLDWIGIASIATSAPMQTHSPANRSGSTLSSLSDRGPGGTLVDNNGCPTFKFVYLASPGK